MNDTGDSSLIALGEEAFAGFDMTIGHVFKQGAVRIIEYKTQEFGAQIGGAFFGLHL